MTINKLFSFYICRNLCFLCKFAKTSRNGFQQDNQPLAHRLRKIRRSAAKLRSKRPFAALGGRYGFRGVSRHHRSSAPQAGAPSVRLFDSTRQLLAVDTGLAAQPPWIQRGTRRADIHPRHCPRTCDGTSGVYRQGRQGADTTARLPSVPHHHRGQLPQGGQKSAALLRRRTRRDGLRAARAPVCRGASAHDDSLQSAQPRRICMEPRGAGTSCRPLHRIRRAGGERRNPRRP